ncbi:hypothetical protein Tco_0129201 [Tanacetum coccineum]
MSLCFFCLPVVTRTSWTDTNPGRRFPARLQIEGKRCIYFGWLDPPICQRAMLIIPGLLRARNKIEADMIVLVQANKKLKKFMSIILDDLVCCCLMLGINGFYNFVLLVQLSTAMRRLSTVKLITHTDYALWEVIVNGDAPAVASASAEGPIPPYTAEQKLTRNNELQEKALSIKTRFGGNKESKKMQKTILKQQYENFVASRSEGLDKTYDRFQKLISQLEIHGEVISQEDANLNPQLDNEDLEQIDTDDLE